MPPSGPQDGSHFDFTGCWHRSTAASSHPRTRLIPCPAKVSDSYKVGLPLGGIRISAPLGLPCSALSVGLAQCVQGPESVCCVPTSAHDGLWGRRRQGAVLPEAAGACLPPTPTPGLWGHTPVPGTQPTEAASHSVTWPVAGWVPPL